MKILGGILVGLVVMAMTLWAVGMLYFSPLLPEPARAIAAGGLAVLLADLPQRALVQHLDLVFHGLQFLAAELQQFRAAFITRVARDLSRWFAAYAHDEHIHDMETD